MNLVINYPKDKNNLYKNIAYIKSSLMKKYIDDLDIIESEKYNIKKALMDKLQNINK